MSDTYSDLGLNQFLQPAASPISSSGGMSAYEFDSLNDRGIVTTPYLQDNAVTNTKVNNLSANKITSGTIDAGTINVINMNAGNISSGTMSFNRASGGTLVLGGTANGNGLMQILNTAGTTIVKGDNLGHHYYGTSGTQELVGVDSLGFHAYNSGGTKLYDINTNGIFGYGTSTGVLRFRTDDSATASYGFMGQLSGSAFYFASGQNNDIFSYADKSNLISADVDVYITADNDIIIESDADVNGGAMYFRNNASNVYLFYDQSAGVYRNLTMNANKTAIMPTSEGYRALYCVESPEVWFMDFVDKKDELDLLFLEVTVPPYKYIRCDDNTYQVWGKRKGKEGVRFEKMTQEQFNQNDKFWSQAYTPAKPDYSALIEQAKMVRSSWQMAKEIIEEKKLERTMKVKRKILNLQYSQSQSENDRLPEYIYVEEEQPVYVMTEKITDNDHPYKEISIQKADEVIRKLEQGIFVDVQDEKNLPRVKRANKAVIDDKDNI